MIAGTATLPNFYKNWLHILDELNIGAFTVDLKRNITAINHCAQGLMNLREAEVLGQDCREIFTGVPCMVSCLFQKNRHDNAHEPDILLRDEDEAEHLITRLATPIYDNTRKVIGCLTILQDHSPIIDLINRIHYEERSSKMILDNLDVGVFTVNRSGLITFFNTAAEKISGYNRSQVLGKPCALLFSGKTPSEAKMLQESVDTGEERNNLRGRIITKVGVTIPIKARYMALRNEKGAVVGGLATFHDMTLVHQYRKTVRDRYTCYDMIGKSPALQKIFQLVDVISESDATVLIEGATGTGKDLLAKVIHSASQRSGKPMVKVNCAALPDNLLESEIFGYVKGAFTGADRDKPGRFQEAEGGTIFLDEIGDLPLMLQAKLLRVIEEKEFYPLGARHILKADVRIISATNRGLEQLVAERLFREDLFYRLNVMRLELPPIKERREDLPLLIHHIFRQLCTSKTRSLPVISPKTMEILLNFDYPGNVREIENILEHALIVSKNDVIHPQHLPEYLQKRIGVLKAAKPNRYPNEKQRILEILHKNNWHKGKTALAMGINRSTLWRKMKLYKLSYEISVDPKVP
ncbi:sigma 54-interacting transcriptional regulator [Desulfococcaceae bacterium HSG9]|nr:sigma 54-interacting transcriptional regulator [Desulfococcaceae bacterium HSG9]